MPPIPAVYPLTLRLAADARTGRTTYADDQSWEVALGQNDQPAVALQTRYGGRVGLLRLVPMVRGESQVLYEARHFSGSPRLTLLTPDALRLEMEITAGLHMGFYAWVIHSQAVGGSLMFTNRTKQPITLTAEIYAQAMREKQTVPMSILTLEAGSGAAVGLSLGQIGNLQPVLLMEHARENPTAKLSAPLTIPPAKTLSVKFVLASFPQLETSLEEAYVWLYNADWNAHVKGIQQRQAQLPAIETGDPELDAAVMLSQQAALRSLIGKTDFFPYPSPVFVRLSGMGFSPNGTGSDHIRPWEGQNALDTYQLVSSLVTLDPSLVKGIIKNYLSVQGKDGFVDAIPGAGGQRAGVLLAPFLAQMTALVYQYTQDKTFVQEVYPRLLRFYTYWFSQDADGDGFPEWQNVLQANLDYHPLFLKLHQMAQESLVALLESPDLGTYLLNEGRALLYLAAETGQPAEKVAPYHEKLKVSLLESWQDNHFIYRDRDTHKALVGETLFSAMGDQMLPAPLTLQAPANLLIQVEGSGTNKPKMLRVRLEGLDREGKPASEVIEGNQFSWYRSRGGAVTRTAWQRIDHLTVEGLSRVYEYQVKTVDLSQRDFSQLLPYTTGILSEKQQKALLNELKEKYGREYGLATSESRDDLQNRMVLPWVMMMGLALLEQGESRLSAELLEKVTVAQVNALKSQGSFFQWYDAVSGAGLGLQEHTTGLIPLHWLMQCIGVVVLDSGTVSILKPFGLKKKVTLVHHGVKIARSTRKLSIRFSSGHTVELPADAPSQVIRDPHYHSTAAETIIEPPAPSRSRKPAQTGKIPLTHEGEN